MTRALQPSRLTVLDYFLLLVFLLGLYLSFDYRISAKIPFPSPPAGIAGLLLLWRRRNAIDQRHLFAVLVVLLVYLASIPFAPNLVLLPKRATGFIQFAYSFLIADALFLTLVAAESRKIAWIFFGFCVLILVGCLLEDYSSGFRAISDDVRLRIFDYGIYDADRRDILIYGRVRPKLFTSEPSSLAFIFTLYAFVWLMMCEWRSKIFWYLGMMAGALLMIHGPTLLLMLVLLVPYLLFAYFRSELAGDWIVRAIGISVIAIVLFGAFFSIGGAVFAGRLEQISSGDDPSFFFREVEPAQVAGIVAHDYPWAGIGLTGEMLIVDRIVRLYQSTPSYNSDLDLGTTAAQSAHSLTNYFWLHWIYLGLVWGSITIFALAAWLRALATPSVTFCFMVWITLGQAAGDYVGPRTWAVFAFAAAGMILQRRAAIHSQAILPLQPYPAHS